MIIDIHAHLNDRHIPCEAWWEGSVRRRAIQSNRPPEKVWQWLEQEWDLTGDKLVQDMAEAGIDKTCVSVIDWGLIPSIGDGKYSITKKNQIYAKAAARHPDHIIAFAGVDPRRPQAIKLLEKAVKEWGMRGLKLMPASGWYPNDKAFYPFYEKVEELGIPVIVHAGPETPPARSIYAQPIFLDDVLLDFPNFNIIVAHAGSCYWEETAEMASVRANLYIDLALWQIRIARRPLEEFYKPLRRILNIMGTPKVLFGSDWPGFRALRRLNTTAWVSVIRELAQPPPMVKEAGIEFSQQEVDAILYGNAAKLLAIPVESEEK